MVQLIHQLRKARVVDISGNLDIENLTPLSEMDNLRSLNYAHTLIDELTPLRSLSRLQTLDPLRYISALCEIDAAFTSVNCRERFYSADHTHHLSIPGPPWASPKFRLTAHKMNVMNG